MGKLPAFQFYPGDWMKDSELRLCSIFARGLLVDLLCIMFEAKHRGKLVRQDGVTPWTDSQIVNAVAGGSESEKLMALQELEENGVLKRDSLGILYSARLVRDEEIRIERSKAGSKGGSKTQANAQANAQANGQANGQAKSGSSSSSSSSEVRVSKDTLYAGFEDWWNAYPRKKEKIAARKAYGKAIQAIAKQHGIPIQAAQDGLLQATIERLPKDPTFEKQFLKYPATWLNGGCYDDEIEKPVNRVATAEDLKSWTPD